MRIGIVISNAATAAPTHTTVYLAQAALEAGHAVRVFEPWDFEIDPRGRLRGRAHRFDAAPPHREALAAALAERTAPRRSVDVDRLDVLLLRTNPLDVAVLAFAQLAADAGVTVLNHPRGMLTYTHKTWLATLADVPRPRTLVTRSRSAVDVFAATCDTGVVVKPARASGGRGVGFVRRHHGERLDAAFEDAARAGDGYVVVQEYLPEAAAGEKRLVWLDGAVVGGYLRMRAPGEMRHNLKVGGQPLPSPLAESDHALGRALAPHLRAEGVWLAGIDVIGGRVVEVNTLNPGGLHWSTTFSGQPLAERMIRNLTTRTAPALSVV